jgi:hypothetical protein
VSRSAGPELISPRLLRPLRILWAVSLAATLVALAAAMPILFSQAHEVCRQSYCNGPQLQPSQIRSLHHSGLSLDVYGIMAAGLNGAFALVYCAVAVLLFVRRSQERMALLSSFFLMIFGGLTFPGVPETLAARYPVLQIPSGLTVMVGAGLLSLFFFLFPNGRFVPLWSRWLVPVLPLLQAPSALFPNSGFTMERIPAILGIVPFLAVLVVIIGSQVYRFRSVSSPVERQQTKWVVLGVGTGMAVFVVLVAASATLPSSFSTSIWAVILPQAVMYAFMLLIPLSIALAVLRYNLWEADALINRTLVYGSLTISLLALYIGGVILLQSLFRTVTGQSSDLAIAIATLGVAALFNPWRRRVQTFIDRRFYRHKYDAARTLTSFTSRLREESDLDRLTDEMVTVIAQTVQPASVSVWLVEGQQL